MNRPNFGTLTDLIGEVEAYCSLLEDGHANALKESGKYKKDREKIVNLTLLLKEEVRVKGAEIVELNEEVNRLKNEGITLNKTITELKKKPAKKGKNG